MPYLMVIWSEFCRTENPFWKQEACVHTKKKRLLSLCCLSLGAHLPSLWWDVAHLPAPPGWHLWLAPRLAYRCLNAFSL